MTSADTAARRAALEPPSAPLTGDDLRAHLYLRCMLPLTDVVLRRSPRLAAASRLAVRAWPRAARTQWRSPTGCVGTTLADGRLHAGDEPRDRTVAGLDFADASEVCAFFRGRPPPSVALRLARHPLAFAPVVAGLTRLQVLAAPARATTPAARALFVDAALCLCALGLSQLARAGHPGAAGVARGPLRVYQWSVAGSELGSYWRVERGKTRAGRGRYGREPAFVHVRFAGVDAAFRALAGQGSQMERLRAGDVETTGSPEYARRVTELLWDLDRLLLVS